ncbi:MAG: hypothetical protein HOV94_21125 [Saccharothrix sp.]|nr:hypothetical protein [Saccharothrix sp.]
MTPHDLSEVFHNHADPPGILHTDRMDGLRTRVRKARRRRAFAAVAFVALALAGGVLVARPSLLDSQPALPEPFPEYLLTSRVLVQTSGHTPEPLVLRYTPTVAPEDLRLIFSCAIGSKYALGNEEALSVTISIDGKEVDQAVCQDNETSIGNEEMRGILRLGQPAVVRMTVLGHMSELPWGTTTTPPVDRAPDGVALRLAVGQHLPVTEFPLPPPPQEPVRLDEYVPDDADIVLRADPADPNRPQKVVVPWRGVSALSLWNGSPGRLRVLIGGDTVADGSNYEYAPSGFVDSAGYDRADLIPGQPVEISVVPEGALGDWVLVLTEKD